MLLLVKCYDNKMVMLPGVSYVGKPHMRLTNNNKKTLKFLKTIRLLTLRCWNIWLLGLGSTCGHRSRGWEPTALACSNKKSSTKNIFFFLMLVLLRRTSFLITFCGLYFSSDVKNVTIFHSAICWLLLH